jgi:hypothetical protein
MARRRWVRRTPSEYPWEPGALATSTVEGEQLDSWDAERVTSLLAKPVELLRWEAPRHGGVRLDLGARPEEAYPTFLDERLLQFRLTRDDLAARRPPGSTRARRRAEM